MTREQTRRSAFWSSRADTSMSCAASSVSSGGSGRKKAARFPPASPRTARFGWTSMPRHPGRCSSAAERPHDASRRPLHEQPAASGVSSLINQAVVAVPNSCVR
jgi:hypothetical protein